MATDSALEASSTPKPKKKRGKGKLIIVVLLPLLILGGAGAGVAYVRGFGPFAKAKPAAASPKGAEIAKSKRPKPSEPPAAAPEPPAPRPTTKRDDDAGATKLAKLWNEVEAPKLLAIAGDWKDRDLARVTARMEPEKVAEILSLLPPKRASALSREMQKIGSIVPIE